MLWACQRYKTPPVDPRVLRAMLTRSETTSTPRACGTGRSAFRQRQQLDVGNLLVSVATLGEGHRGQTNHGTTSAVANAQLVIGRIPWTQNQKPPRRHRDQDIVQAAASCPLLRPRSLACRRPTSITSESCSWNSQLWEHLIPLEKTFNVKTRNLPFRLLPSAQSLSTEYLAWYMLHFLVDSFRTSGTATTSNTWYIGDQDRGSFDSLPVCNTSFVFFFTFFQLVNYAHISTHCRLTVSFVVLLSNSAHLSTIPCKMISYRFLRTLLSIIYLITGYCVFPWAQFWKKRWKLPEPFFLECYFRIR